MASGLSKGNRFYDIMTRTDSDLYDILSGITGLRIGDQEYEILYIQDSGEKISGICYIDRNDRRLYKCIQTTYDTSNTTECFTELNLSNQKATYDNYLGVNRYINPYTYHVGHLARDTSEDIKYAVFEFGFQERGYLFDLKFNAIEYRDDKHAITTVDIINYMYGIDDYDYAYSIAAYTRTLSMRTNECGIQKILYSFDKSKKRYTILLEARNNFCYWAIDAMITGIATANAEHFKLVECRYMTESEKNSTYPSAKEMPLKQVVN